MARLADAVECLDRPVAAGDRAASLADVDRLGSWFGGHALTRRAIARLAPARGALTVLDVGGGRGDFAVRLARRRRPARVVVVERDPETLALAAATVAREPAVRLVCADATALPFRRGAVDVAVTALTLHHLAPDAAIAALAELRRVARGGAVVNDLLRSRVALALVWLATRLVARHPFSRVDGPLSVRRAYAPAELAALAARAGLRDVTVRRYPWLARVVAVAR